MTEPSPIDAFLGVSGNPGVAFLDGGAGRQGRSYLAWSPAERLEIDPRGLAHLDRHAAESCDPLIAIEAFVDRQHARGRTVIGALSYDLRRWIEPRAGGPPRGSRPLAVLSAYDDVACYDSTTARWQRPPASRFPAARASRLRARLLGPGLPIVERATYRQMFSRVRQALVDGEIYQANLAIAFEAALRGEPSELYRRLSGDHAVPFGAYLDCGRFQILCNSPELFLARRGRTLITRPIKGTRPRSHDARTDRRLVHELRESTKENAEHVMIVDLERNDLGRVAVPGSVVVPRLAECVTFPTLHHLESTVTAELRADVSLAALLRATFPGGSITGAPKVRAMQLIDEVEPIAREFYTGAILHLPPNGDLTASISIRCAITEGGILRYGAGGGIVIDSDPEAEYEECLLKAKALFAAGGSAVVERRR